MAYLEDLLDKIPDPILRKQAKAALKERMTTETFGLRFEKHLPEMTALPGVPVSVGSVVMWRDKPSSSWLRIVEEIIDGTATLRPKPTEGDAAPIARETAPVADLIVCKEFNEPIYPGLAVDGEPVERGGADKPWHMVINGENAHAAELLRYLYGRKVDCIYLDPPYNTGAKDWTYNNDYVDATDGFRHSKWLSFMEKRLALAKDLLKPDGVLIVTIDEHEVHHLAMLMEEVFPGYLRYMVTIVINPKGTAKSNFSRTDEQAFFVVPNTGFEIIAPKPLPKSVSDFRKSESEDDDEDDSDSEIESFDEPVATKGDFEYQHARRRGTESSYRHQRPNQFYPIFIDEKKKIVVKVGHSLPRDVAPDLTFDGRLRPIYPIDREGNHRCWRFHPDSMRKELDLGNLFVGQYNKEFDSWTLNIRRPKKVDKKLKSVWDDTSYDAGTHGTGMIRRIFGEPGFFAFPKSLY